MTADSGREFATVVGHILARLGIYHITTSVKHPSSNGVVERLVGSFKSILTRHVNDHLHTWLQALPYVQMCYMQRVHSAIGVSPNEMLIGHKHQLPLPVGDILLISFVGCGPEPDGAAAAEHLWDLTAYFLDIDLSVWQSIEAQYYRNRLIGVTEKSASPAEVLLSCRWEI